MLMSFIAASICVRASNISTSAYYQISTLKTKHPYGNTRITEHHCYCYFTVLNRLTMMNMRGLIKGVYTLFMLSMLLAFMHSCTLDNHILKPSCLIFEVDLDEKWWYPDEQTENPVYFRSNGRIRREGQTDSLTFVLENCNKLKVTDHIGLTEEQWVIKHISLEELHLLFPNEKLVKYTRRR